MPYPIQSRADIEAQLLADFQSRISGADTTVRKSVLRILAKIVSYPVLAANRFLLWVLKQTFTTTAEAPYLDTGLVDYGVTRLGATAAAGNVVFSGTNGIPVPAGTLLQTGDGSISYVTQASVTIASGLATAAVLATSAGAATNANPGASLDLAGAIPGVQPTATVDGGGLTGGVDTETDAALRVRGLARKQQPPQGGAASDYVAWAKAVSGVTRVWVYPLGGGPGTVNVLFAMDGRTNNIPLAGDIAAVQAAIDANRPVTAYTTVYAPIPDALSITITGMVPNTTAVQNAVVAQLQALARQVVPGGAAAGDGLPTTLAGRLDLSQIFAAIQAGGATYFDLTLPAADVTFVNIHLPAAPTVTFL